MQGKVHPETCWLSREQGNPRQASRSTRKLLLYVLISAYRICPCFRPTCRATGLLVPTASNYQKHGLILDLGKATLTGYLIEAAMSEFAC